MCRGFAAERSTSADNAAKARTNQQRFAATQFVYEAEQDRYICPAKVIALYEANSS